MVHRYSPALRVETTFKMTYAVMINDSDGKFVKLSDYKALEERCKYLEATLSLSFARDLMNGSIFNGYKLMPVVATGQMAAQASHITAYTRNVWSLMVSATPSYNDAKGKYG
jgi:hypothetical protein